jgi:hypothetical protein
MGFHERNALVLTAWVPITALLFRLLGPRRAALVAVVGGHVFLPGMAAFVEFFPPSILRAAAKVSWLYFEKHASIGMGLILGIACCDRRALLSARPSWLDLPILAYVLYPLTGVANDSPAALLDSIGASLIRGLCWLPPYLAARLYFGDDEGVRRVAVAIVVASLINVPICLWETTMGPRWYVAGFLYRWDFVGGMVSRLGGWRPEGLMGYGIDLTNWMALAALLSFWLWLGRVWRPKWGPAWWPPLLLIGTAFAIRGLYGDIYLVVGLTVALLTWTFRTRWFILALAALVPLYLNLRYFGVLTRNQAETHELLQRIGKTSSLGTRFWSEDAALAVIYPDRFLFGTGVDFWHFKYVKPPFLGPGSDGWWVTLVYAGGFLGLALHYLAVHLTPAGLALAYPPRRPTRQSAVSPAWGLALWSLLHMIDSLQNSIRMTPTLLIAGALVGQAVTRRRKTQASSSSSSSTAVEAPTPTALVPAVAAIACLLYVFGHGPVEGYEPVKLVGGLGAALLFAAAGGLGAWAAGRFPISRVAVYGLLFATLGVSFNLFIHPASRPVGTADILQGLALCGVAVACWRRVAGDRVWADSALAVAPMVVHFLVRPRVAAFPGSQYLLAAADGELALFPLCPWLTFAVLGARASRARWPVHLTAGALFALAAGVFWLDGLGSGRGEPVKFPMNPTYALLSCAAVGLAFALAEGLNRVERARRGARWLGGRWLVFFYAHFAGVVFLQWSGARPAWEVWTLLAVGSLAATWLVSEALAPLAPWFKQPAPWVVLLAMTLAAAALPGLAAPWVSAVAGLAGLILGAQYGALATCVASTRSLAAFRFRFHFHPLAARKPAPPPRPRPTVREQEPELVEPEPRDAGELGRNLLRLLVVLALLALPEVIEAVGGRKRPVPVPARSRPKPPPLESPPHLERETEGRRPGHPDRI